MSALTSSPEMPFLVCLSTKHPPPPPTHPHKPSSSISLQPFLTFPLLELTAYPSFISPPFPGMAGFSWTPNIHTALYLCSPCLTLASTQVWYTHCQRCRSSSVLYPYLTHTATFSTQWPQLSHPVLTVPIPNLAAISNHIKMRVTILIG